MVPLAASGATAVGGATAASGATAAGGATAASGATAAGGATAADGATAASGATAMVLVLGDAEHSPMTILMTLITKNPEYVEA